MKAKHTLTARRLTGALAGGALVAGAMSVLLPATAQAAEPGGDPKPVQLGAAWLMAQRDTDTGLIAVATEQAPYPTNVDVTVEAANGLAAAGQTAEAVTLTDAVALAAPDAIEWTGNDPANPLKAVRAHSVAAMTALAVTQERDPSDFGGENLLQRLESLIATDGPATGRIGDEAIDEGAVDSAGTAEQAAAVTALTGAKSELAESAVAYLRLQQCPDGHFRAGFTADPAAEQQGCSDNSESEQNALTGSATARAVIALAPLAKDNAELTGALAKAGTWLEAQMKAAGRVDAASGVLGRFSLVTGQAGQALAALDRTTQVGRAATWLRGRQLVAGCVPDDAKASGAVVAGPSVADDSTKVHGKPWALDKRGTAVATAASLAALQHAPAASALPWFSLPAWGQTSRQAAATITSLAPGERVCIAGAPTLIHLIGTEQPSLVVMPKEKKGRYTYTLRSERRSMARTIQLLPRKTLPVTANKDSVKRKKKMVVSVKGLAAGEHVQIRIAGRWQVSGKATASGTFTQRFKVKGNTKLGKVKVQVRGKFANRKGNTPILVKKAKK